MKINVLSMILIVMLGMSLAVGDVVSFTAGEGRTFSGDWLYVNPEPPIFMFSNDSDDGFFSLVIDLGSSKLIDKIIFVNRKDTATSYVASQASIWVAPDESSPSFNPNSSASFTTRVSDPSNEYFSPNQNIAGLERGLELSTKVVKRYILIKFYSNFYGDLGDMGNSARNLIQCGDIKLGTIETSAGLVTSLGGDFIEFYPDAEGSGQSLLLCHYDPQGTDTDGSIDCLIDLGSKKSIKTIKITNRKDIATDYGIAGIKVFVASDEDSLSFDPFLKDSYMNQIFNGDVVPMIHHAKAIRMADINDINDVRFLRLSITSNFFGNMSWDQNQDLVQVGDIDVIGAPNAPTNCGEVSTVGYLLLADLSGNCHIGFEDLAILTSQWLQCSDPANSTCTEQSNPVISHSISKTTDQITVDGDISDWTGDIEWIPLDKHYTSVVPTDIIEAKFAIRWNDSNKLYLAVVVKDNDHIFASSPDWAGDLIEVYCQGMAADGFFYGVYDIAQQYEISKDWATWSDLTAIGEDAGFQKAVAVYGNEIIYETVLTPFDSYAGKGGAGSTVISQLTANKVIRFDIVSQSQFGTETGILSENLMTGKYQDPDKFAEYTIVDQLPCGSWGFMKADINSDCYVDFLDFAKISLQWANCNDPQDITCVANW